MATDPPRLSRIVIEGGVIVFSVLVALAADAAWGERQANRDAREELRAVLQELQEQHREISTAHAWHSRALTGSRALRQRLESIELNAPITVPDSLASQMVWVYQTEGESPVLDAFLEAGHLERVRSDELQLWLLAWGPMLRDLASDDGRTASHIADQILPYVNQHFDFGRPVDLVFEMYVGDPDPDDLGTTQLRSTLPLRNLLARHISMLTLITSQSSTALQRLSDMMELVEQELR